MTADASTVDGVGDGPTDDVAVDAADVRGYLHQRRKRTGMGQILYQVYVVLLFGTFGMVVWARTQQLSRATAASAAPFVSWLPAVLPLLLGGMLVAGMRLGTWAGPVLLSRADVAWLLTAPVRRDQLLLPRLLTALGLGAVFGVVAAVVSSFVLGVSTAGGLAAIIGANLVAWTSMGVLAAALSWFVERSDRVAARVLQSTPVALLLGVALVFTARSHPGPWLWVGPWGWAAAPVLAASGLAVAWWPVGLVLAVGTAALAAVLAIHTVGDAHHEQLARRAGLLSAVSASLYVLDVRTVSLMRGSLQRWLTPTLTLRIPRPHRRWLAVPWRDAVALARTPAQVGWAAVLLTAGIALGATQPHRTLALTGAAVLGYLAATRLLEPMRIEIEEPGASQLLPGAYATVVITHAAVPVGLLTVTGWLAVGGLTLGGVIPVAALGWSLVVTPGLAALLVGCGAVAAHRGEVPMHYLVYGDMGMGMLLGWLLLGPYLAGILLGAPLAVLSRAAVPPSSAAALAVPYGLLTASIMLAVVWYRVGRSASSE